MDRDTHRPKDPLCRGNSSSPMGWLALRLEVAFQCVCGLGQNSTHEMARTKIGKGHKKGSTKRFSYFIN